MSQRHEIAPKHEKLVYNMQRNECTVQHEPFFAQNVTPAALWSRTAHYTDPARRRYRTGAPIRKIRPFSVNRPETSTRLIANSRAKPARRLAGPASMTKLNGPGRYIEKLLLLGDVQVGMGWWEPQVSAVSLWVFRGGRMGGFLFNGWLGFCENSRWFRGELRYFKVLIECAFPLNLWRCDGFR